MAISQARLAAQRRQVEVNGHECLSYSARWTFSQSDECLAVREELKALLAEKRRMSDENSECSRLDIKPAYSREAMREMMTKCNTLRVRLSELTR